MSPGVCGTAVIQHFRCGDALEVYASEYSIFLWTAINYMLQPDFKPLTLYKPFNQIVSWSARFKTGLVYAKSKSGSINWLARSKSGPAHALDGLPPCAHGQRSFCVPNKSY